MPSQKRFERTITVISLQSVMILSFSKSGEVELNIFRPSSQAGQSNENINPRS